MNVKIDTKERFTVITPLNHHLSETMTDKMNKLLLPYLKNTIKNVILNMENVQVVDLGVANELIMLQQAYYANDASFVVCCLSKDVETFLDQTESLELLNYTPSESEAWDIVQMEEIERELFDDDIE